MPYLQTTCDICWRLTAPLIISVISERNFLHLSHRCTGSLCTLMLSQNIGSSMTSPNTPVTYFIITNWKTCNEAEFYIWTLFPLWVSPLSVSRCSARTSKSLAAVRTLSFCLSVFFFQIVLKRHELWRQPECFFVYYITYCGGCSCFYARS